MLVLDNLVSWFRLQFVGYWNEEIKRLVVKLLW